MERAPLRADCNNAERWRRVSLSLDEQRQEGVGQAFDVTETDDGRLPAQGHTAGRNMHQHQYNVNPQHDIETTFSEWQVRTAVENVSGESANGEFGAEESQLAVFEHTGHERIAFAGHVQSNPEEC
jgi:hypothetical protein